MTGNIIDEKEYWITKNDDLISYSQLDESYAENLLNYFKRINKTIPEKLKDRLEFLKSEKNSKVLFDKNREL